MDAAVHHSVAAPYEQHLGRLPDVAAVRTNRTIDVVEGQIAG
jgi:hypothetical protein